MSKLRAIPTSERSKSFEQIMFEEGFGGLYINGSTSSGSTIPSGGSVQANIIPNTSPQLYKYLKVKTNVQFTASAPILVVGGGRTVFDPINPYINGYGATSGEFNFEIDFPNYPLASLVFYGAVGTVINWGLTTTYIKMTNDLNLDAEQTIVWIGDSVMAGTFNTDMKRNDLFHFGVKHFLENKLDEKLRNVIIAEGGRQSTDFVNLFRRNDILSTNPKIIFLMTGINDQSQSISLATFESNLREIVDIKNKKYPNTILCLVSATPVENNTRETSLATYRTKMSDVVTNINDPYLKYIDMTNCYDRTLGSAIWATSDGAGTDRLHPGTALAHLGMYNRINSEVDNFTF